MTSIKRFWYAFIVIVLSALFFGCDEDGSRGVIEPWDDEPMILESVMCLDVDEGRPVGITSSFIETDERVYIWIYWINIEDRSTIEIAWFEPGEDLPFLEESERIGSDADSLITWFSIDKPTGGFIKGEWAVDIYLDGEFERSHLFTVK
jgi:hypothetical protein